MKRHKSPSNSRRRQEPELPAGKSAVRTGHRRAGRQARGAKATKPDQVLLYGWHTVRAALNNPQRKVTQLYLTENARAKLADRDLQRHHDLIEIVPAVRLEQLVGGEAVHQGVVARCVPLEMLDASELFHLADARLILALDQITDPHNAGAILRSACAIGADAVLTTHRNSAQETAVMAKAASGALDSMRLISLRNLSKAIAELNGMGFVSIGLDSQGSAVLSETLEVESARQVVLVLGAEHRGLRQKTRETCTMLARLDMPGPIKSLNVSNAATLSLYITARHLIDGFG